jgi:Flp pilus assembly protein protease CpaA
MKEVLEFMFVVCLAILVLGVVKLLNNANKRLLAGGSMWGGRIQPRGSNRFPLIPTNDSEVERKRPAVGSGP